MAEDARFHKRKEDPAPGKNRRFHPQLTAQPSVNFQISRGRQGKLLAADACPVDHLQKKIKFILAVHANTPHFVKMSNLYSQYLLFSAQ